MVQNDNEFFRGPPEGSPTLTADQRPTGAEVFQAKPFSVTVAADVPTTAQEELPKDPPKKKSKARRITKAIKLLASCMAAVVITEAAVNMAATIEPPAEVPVGQYYAGQWGGVGPVDDGVYMMEMDSDMGYSIQIPLDGNVWCLSAENRNWRMCWYEGTDSGLPLAYISVYSQDEYWHLMADVTPEPHYTDYEEDCYTTMTTSTGETLYIRAFFLSLGNYGDEYGLDEAMVEESAELRQALVDDIFAGIQVTPGTANGWQGFQIGDKLYSQQSEDWYGLGGFGDLEIHIPWVNYAADYGLHDKTPYARETINGITWSIYFTDDDTYLWAVPNIDPEICLGGYVSRFMCADAVRRGEYINDEEWLEMGGFTSASQRQTAVDILIECLQHHYALQSKSWLHEWPRMGPVRGNVRYNIQAQSQRGTSIQFSFGDRAYRITSDNSALRFHWDMTSDDYPGRWATFRVSFVTAEEELWEISMEILREDHWGSPNEEGAVYAAVSDAGGETLYLRFRSYWSNGEPEHTKAELTAIANTITDAIGIAADPDNSGWGRVLICDTMYSPQTMDWSGHAMVWHDYVIDRIQYVDTQGLENEMPCEVRTINTITWSFYYDAEDEVIWASPDLEPGVCIGAEIAMMHEYYRSQHPGMVTDGWNDQYGVPADDVNHAVEALSEGLAHFYPLGMEPQEEWYIPDWPNIHQITADHSYGLMDYSGKGTFSQFSLGDVSYRLESTNPSLCFFWNETEEVAGVMQADLYINHMTSNRRDWRVELFIQAEPFSAPRAENMEIDATVPAADGSYLYLRFRRTWWYGDHEPSYETFSGWVNTVLNAVSVSPADPNGWGQVWICDLMTTPLSENWDGNAKVTEDYEIPYFNRVEEQGLTDLEPYAMMEFNGIVWTFVYEEADDIIWGIPDIEDRWCIGAPAREMAAWYLGGDPEEDYLDAAVEGLAEGLSKYYPRRGFVMEPVEDAVWPGLVPTGDGANWGISSWSNRNTEGLFSLGGNVFQIDSYREDLRFWWQIGFGDMAAVEIYSIPDQSPEQWSVLVWIQQTPFATYEGDADCYRTVRLPGNENLYLRFDPSDLGDYDLDAVADEILQFVSFDYCGKEENWHTVYIGNTLQSQQSYDWTGMSMVYQDYSFDFLHTAESVDLYLQDYEGQREINGILWTFHFHKDNDILYAYPDTEPELCIGASPDKLWSWYDAQYGALDNYFETIVESMCEGLKYITLRDSQ